jgi:hypothetical protein
MLYIAASAWPVIGITSIVYVTRKEITWFGLVMAICAGTVFGPLFLCLCFILWLFSAPFWKNKVFDKKREYFK